MSDATVQMMQQARLEEPKSTVGLFELPCGYLDPQTGEVYREVQVRELTGRDEDMLASKAVPEHKKIGQLIANCLVRLGPITDRGRLATLVDELLQGDRVFLMFAIRRTSLGDDYPFKDKCPNEDCKHEGIFTLNLAELSIKQMARPELRSFEAKLPSGARVRFHPLCGRDEELLAKASNKEAAISLAMLLRIDSIDDVAPTLAAVQNWGWRDRQMLRDAFEEVEGGVDTSLDMQCPMCLHEFEREVKLEPGFFFPSKVLKDWKKKSST